MDKWGAVSGFLLHKFVVAGVTFQNWMIVFAVVVLIVLFYLYLRSRSENSS